MQKKPVDFDVSTTFLGSKITDCDDIQDNIYRHTRIRDGRELQDFYQYREQIGKGSFGIVYCVQDLKSYELLAMKIVEKAKLGKKLAIIESEIKILKMVEHPNIIRLEKVFESDKKFFLIMELCPATLKSVLKEKNHLTELETKKIITQLSSAVAYLHKKDIVHRDLKLENILLAVNPTDPEDLMFVKVSDFGLSVIIPGHSHKTMLSDTCGTMAYMSPEILSTHSYSQQCDIWSIGVIMHLLLIGHYPFIGENDEILINRICNSEPDFSDFPASMEAVNLMKRMLTKNPAFRIAALEVVQHPWIKGKKITEDLPDHVLEMMRQWKQEMTLDNTQDPDWLLTDAVPGTSESSPQHLDTTSTGYINTPIGTQNGKRSSSHYTPKRNVPTAQQSHYKNQKKST